MRLGLDFGGVIVPTSSRRVDTSLDRGGAQQGPFPGALEGIRRLVDEANGRVWIVSKAGQRVQQQTLNWMRDWEFFRATGMKEANICFCLTREEKSPICSQLALTHFVDDRIHVIQILRGVVPNLIRFGDAEELIHTPRWADHVSDWASLVERLVGPKG